MFRSALTVAAILCAAPFAGAAEMCESAGPQSPRDIDVPWGLNKQLFDLAPPAEKMNLCNIHIHKHAEHKGPGFSLMAGRNKDDGWKCNGTYGLTKTERKASRWSYFNGVEPGDTVEAHWVYTSCDAKPGKGLEACVPDGCENPVLRVEAQVFLLVNDPTALNFVSFTYSGEPKEGPHQPWALPEETGKPVVYRGSTTDPAYPSGQCSPAQVTWSVRPQCDKLDVNSLHRWVRRGSVFKEDKAHGVRTLITDRNLLSLIR